jgi:putative membrane fusion protein
MVAILGLAVIIVWFVLVKASGLMLPLRLRTTVARWDVVEQQWTGSAFAVRKETVERAPAEGRVKLLVPEGARVRAGVAVCQIGSSNVRAPSPGVVSFSLDGLEETASADSFLHGVTVPKREEPARVLADGEQVSLGTPLFRLVDDFSWHLYVAVRGAQPLPTGRSVVVRFATGEVQMRVDRAEEREDKLLAQLTGDHLPAECLYIRSFDVRLVADRREGVVVPVASLVPEENGRRGVFMLVEKSPLYRRLDVLAANEESALVTGVPVGARVVTNPRALPRRYRK